MAITTAAAILGSAVIGGIASRNAAKKAAAAQQGASDAAAAQTQIAREQWDRYRERFMPLEDQMVAEAQDYDSPERFAEAAGEASADVGLGFARARDRLTRTPGLDPSSAGYSASMIGLNASQAASDATAQNAARRGVRDTGYARRLDALSLGKGLPAQASTGFANAGGRMQGIADGQYRIGMDQAASAGRIADRVFSGATSSNWLGNVGTAMKYDTNIGSEQTRMLQEQDSVFQ